MIPTMRPRLRVHRPFNLWRIRPGNIILYWKKASPAQLFVSSFLLLIVLGTVGLKTLPGLYTGEPLNWLNAVFTATSAVCVTGLIVVDTATYFTQWGQAFLLLLIQLGGLGIVSFASLVVASFGGRLSLRQQALSGSGGGVVPQVNVRKLTIDVFRFTFFIEAVGAVLLYLFWIPSLGWKGAAWPALFHSISAFCNAGFSTFSDSLMGYQHHVTVLLTMMLLIVIGGLGFLTLEELKLWHRARRTERKFRLTLHSQIVLFTTGILLVSGWVLYLVFEWNLTLSALPWWDKLNNALFMSVTARTAGFNTIDYGSASESSNFLTLLLMSVGGSPGSTAGGMKTTTLALVLLIAWARMRGRSIVSLRGRSVPDQIIQQAIGLVVVGLAVIIISVFVVSVSEDPGIPFSETGGNFLSQLFEIVSAFNTVGLSTGITDQLNVSSRLATIVVMFLGRVGPLVFASALAARQPVAGDRFRFAYETVSIG